MSAGTFWPPLINWSTQAYGWRATHFGIAIACGVLMTILLLVLRQVMGGSAAQDHANAPPPRVDLKLSANTLTVLLCIASISCCVAMAMPQVHIVVLLRRSRLWRGARRGNAVADDGVRHRQPYRLGISGRQDRRHARR